jgi:hypothetical protein
VNNIQNNQPKLIEATNANVKQIKTILHWLHKEGGEAHCLVRLYIWSDTSKALAVLSELRSNPPGLDITRDFIGVAKSLIQLLGTHINFQRKYCLGYASWWFFLLRNPEPRGFH